MRGRLIEVNQRLASTPALLTSVPERDGYIAIVQPHGHEHRERPDLLTRHLLAPDAYRALRSSAAASEAAPVQGPVVAQ